MTEHEELSFKVVRMRSAAYWGLEQGQRYKGSLFAPMVNRSGHLLENDEKHRLVDLVKKPTR
jgi:hypothetical protein